MKGFRTQFLCLKTTLTIFDMYKIINFKYKTINIFLNLYTIFVCPLKFYIHFMYACKDQWNQQGIWLSY